MRTNGARTCTDSQSWRQVSIDDLISWDTAARLLSRVHWRCREASGPPARLARAPRNARRPRADAQHAQVPVMNAQVHCCA